MWFTVCCGAQNEQKIKTFYFCGSSVYQFWSVSYFPKWRKT